MAAWSEEHQLRAARPDAGEFRGEGAPNCDGIARRSLRRAARPAAAGGLFPTTKGSSIQAAGDSRFALDTTWQESGRDDGRPGGGLVDERQSRAGSGEARCGQDDTRPCERAQRPGGARFSFQRARSSGRAAARERGARHPPVRLGLRADSPEGFRRARFARAQSAARDPRRERRDRALDHGHARNCRDPNRICRWDQAQDRGQRWRERAHDPDRGRGSLTFVASIGAIPRVLGCGRPGNANRADRSAHDEAEASLRIGPWPEHHACLHQGWKEHRLGEWRRFAGRAHARQRGR